jgi:hypothetical protein
VTLTVSPAVKIFGLVAVLATVLLVGGMTFMGPNAEDTSFDEPVVLPKKKESALAVPKAPEKTAAKADKSATVEKSTLKAKTAVAAKPAPKPKPKPVVAENGLPTALVSALAANAVVVVMLFDDAAKVDPLARDEAEAGAKLAGAGYVELDVTRDQKASEALMLKLGTVLRAPMTLFYIRPGDLAVRLDGFRDRETVAQAAVNAQR